MTELRLASKQGPIRVDRGMSCSFIVKAPDDFDGVAELRIYAVGATTPTIIEGSLLEGDFVFDIDNAVSATLPRYGRYAVVWTDADDEPHSIVKGSFFAEDIP